MGIKKKDRSNKIFYVNIIYNKMDMLIFEKFEIIIIIYIFGVMWKKLMFIKKMKSIWILKWRKFYIKWRCCNENLKIFKEKKIFF